MAYGPDPSGRPANSRAPRGSLNRERIVEAALSLVDQEGTGGLTMPRLASLLGVGTMSLYRHVRNKDDLVEAVTDRIFQDLEAPSDPDGDGLGRVVTYLVRWRELALAHPALVDILATRPVATRRIYEHLEANLSILTEAGFADLDGVRAFYTLFAYVFGFVIWELPRTGGRSPEPYMADRRDELDELPAGRFPALTDLGDLLSTSVTEEQFTYGLNLLVDALERSRFEQP